MKFSRKDGVGKYSIKQNGIQNKTKKIKQSDSN